jgi:hypothetical protein
LHPGGLEIGVKKRLIQIGKENKAKQRRGEESQRKNSKEKNRP